MRRVPLLVLLFTLLVGSTVLTTAAQDGTPVAGEGGFPLSADPALCTVEPRDPQELLDIWFTPEGSPVPGGAGPEDFPAEVTIPLGEPVDDEAIIAGVTTTVHEVFSCFAAGDYRRASALFTDDLVREFGPGPGETREDVAGFLEASPVPEAAEEQTQILAITDVMLLNDGRVGAFAVDEVGTAYAIFEQAGDRWLVDEVIEFSAGDEGEE